MHTLKKRVMFLGGRHTILPSIETINTTNDLLMTRLGLRPRLIHKHQLTKTPKLAAYLKRVKSNHKKSLISRGLDTSKVLNAPTEDHKLINEQLKKAKEDHFKSNGVGKYPLISNISNF